MGQKELNIFQETINEQLLGPGSDVFADKDPNCEIISDTPLRRYFTGILFPRKITQTQGELDNDQFESSDDNEEEVSLLFLPPNAAEKCNYSHIGTNSDEMLTITEDFIDNK